MSSRACPREKIYFVVNEKHLFKKWPELVSEPRPFAPDECPERIISGRDCWIILTWARLCAVDCPFDSVLSCRAVDNAVCVFHWDDATPAQGVHRCFAVVAQADRPRPALSYDRYAERVDGGDGAAADDAALAPAGFDSTRSRTGRSP